MEASGKHRRRLAEEVEGKTIDEQSIRKIRGHRLPLTCLALSHDDRTAFTASKDGSIIQYDIETGKKIRFKFKSSTTKKAGPNPVSGTNDSESSSPKRGHILALALSSDGKFLASAGHDKYVCIWDTRSNALIESLKGHRKHVTGLAFREGTHELYSASLDYTVKVWNLDEMSYVETLFGHQSGVMAIDCLDQDRPITAGGSDRSSRLWKITEETHLVFREHTASIDAIAYVNPQFFLTGSQDGSICLWNINQKKSRGKILNAHPFLSTPQASAPQTSESGGGGGQGIGTAGHWIVSVAACKNSDLAASGSSDGVVRLWGLHAGGFRPLLPIPAMTGYVNALAFASSGRFLLAALGQEHRLGRWDRNSTARNALAIVPLPVAT